MGHSDYAPFNEAMCVNRVTTLVLMKNLLRQGQQDITVQ